MGTKIIPSNYPSIQHLPNSKIWEASDKHIGQQEVDLLTRKTRSPADVVIVTEKVDGCNVGILRQGDTLHPILRKGYDVRSNPFDWIQRFSDFAEANRERLLRLLEDGERLCGEWMIKTHTIPYALPHEPLVCFDLIKGAVRVPYLTARDRLLAEGFTCAGLVHYGVAIETTTAISLLGEGFHGAEGQPEGVVYRYESAEHGWLFCAKFVSNPTVGDQELLARNIESGLKNRWTGGFY